MVVDTSAILAVLFDEPEAETFLAALRSVAQPAISAANWLEVAIVIDGRKGPEWLPALDAFLEGLAVVVVPVSLRQVHVARDAYRRFGKGNHPDGLNFGDCFAYALAKECGLPLLYKGSDFARTDLRPAPQA
jgi:ribonuclease VapC